MRRAAARVFAATVRRQFPVAPAPSDAEIVPVGARN